MEDKIGIVSGFIKFSNNVLQGIPVTLHDSIICPKCGHHKDNNRTITTDLYGRYRFTNLIVGKRYYLAVNIDDKISFGFDVVSILCCQEHNGCNQCFFK